MPRVLHTFLVNRNRSSSLETLAHEEEGAEPGSSLLPVERIPLLLQLASAEQVLEEARGLVDCVLGVLDPSLLTTRRVSGAYTYIGRSVVQYVEVFGPEFGQVVVGLELEHHLAVLVHLLELPEHGRTRPHGHQLDYSAKGELRLLLVAWLLCGLLLGEQTQSGAGAHPRAREAEAGRDGDHAQQREEHVHAEGCGRGQ